MPHSPRCVHADRCIVAATAAFATTGCALSRLPEWNIADRKTWTNCLHASLCLVTTCDFHVFCHAVLQGAGRVPADRAGIEAAALVSQSTVHLYSSLICLGSNCLHGAGCHVVCVVLPCRVEDVCVWCGRRLDRSNRLSPRKPANSRLIEF